MKKYLKRMFLMLLALVLGCTRDNQIDINEVMEAEGEINAATWRHIFKSSTKYYTPQTKFYEDTTGNDSQEKKQITYHEEMLGIKKAFDSSDKSIARKAVTYKKLFELVENGTGVCT